jgi:hypothetical protein
MVWNLYPGKRICSTSLHILIKTSITDYPKLAPMTIITMTNDHVIENALTLLDQFTCHITALPGKIKLHCCSYPENAAKPLSI